MQDSESKDNSPEARRSRMRETLRTSKSMPASVRRQYKSTIRMVRSPAEWEALETAFDTEIAFYERRGTRRKAR